MFLTLNAREGRHIDSWIYFQITVLTSQPGKEVVKQLESGLKDIDLVQVRRLQVVEITKGALECMDSASPIEEPSNEGKELNGKVKRMVRILMSSVLQVRKVIFHGLFMFVNEMKLTDSTVGQTSVSRC